jgi:imidazolonepropionase-like amidohydrolase
VALVGATVVDGTGAPPRPRCTVLIEDERIRAVGPDVEVPAGAEVIDVAGKMLVPGMIDMHGHLFTNLGGTFESQVEPFARLYLAGGVTTVFTAGEEHPEEALAFRDDQRAGRKVGTRVYSPGPYFDHVGDGEGTLDGPESARALFAQWKDRIDGVKVYTGITAEELGAIVEAAHAAGLTVTGHLGSLTARQAIQIGIDRLEHGLYAMSEFDRPSPASPFGREYMEVLADIDFDADPGKALIAEIVASGVVLDPTTVVLESLFAGPLDLTDWKRYLAPDALQRNEALSRGLGAMRAREAPPDEWGPLVEAVLAKQRELVGRVHAAGGKVVAGTDPVFPDIVPGHALHREVEHLVLSGLTELEAIRACTLDAAAALGRAQDLGSIEPGKLADLVVLARDPVADITALGTTEAVFQAGARFSPEELRASVVGTIR